MLLRDAMHQQIVDKSAGGRHQAGVLRLAVDEFRGVVASDVLHEIQGVRAAHLDFAHVADVENARAVRIATCSDKMPEYSTGMSQPPKLTILAPRRRWAEFRAVLRS